MRQQNSLRAPVVNAHWRRGRPRRRGLAARGFFHRACERDARAGLRWTAASLFPVARARQSQRRGDVAAE
eukprot:555143-Pyramimonas_sp.AAC.1